MYITYHLLFHLAETLKHRGRKFNKFKITLRPVIWWQGSSNVEVKFFLLLQVTLESDPVNRHRISWLILACSLRVHCAVSQRAGTCPCGKRTPLEPSRRALASAMLRARQLVPSTGHGQLHEWSSQLSLENVGSQYWIVQGADRILPFYKWKEK